MFYSRFFLVAFMCLIMVACSRDYEVTIPAQVVQQDVDCSFGDVQTALFDSVEVFAETSSSEPVVLYSASDVTDSAIFLESSGATGTLKVRATALPDTAAIVFSGGLDAMVGGITLEAFFQGGDASVAAGSGEAIEVSLKDGINELKVVAEVTVDVTETREACYFLSSVREVNDEEIRTREIELTGTLNFSFSLKELSDSSIPAVHSSVLESEFGTAVALNQNYLAVGEPGNSHEYTSLSNVTLNSLPESGAVHLYEKVSSSDWTLCAILKASNARVGDGFGSALAWSEGQLIVGSPFEDRAGGDVYLGPASDQALAYSKPDSGAVYVFENSSADVCGFEEVAYIKSPDNPTTMTFTDAGFGSSLHTYKNELLIGAPAQQGETIASVAGRIGKAYLYEKNVSGDFELLQQYSSGVNHDGEEFANSVALGERLMIIGAPGDSVLESNVDSFGGVVVAAELPNGTLTPLSSESGGAYLYLRDDSDSAFGFVAYLKPNNNDDGDRFGEAVMVSSESAFVGAPNEDSSSDEINTGASNNSLANSGAVYHYELREDDTVTQRNYIKSPTVQGSMNFGANLDANTEFLAIAAPGYFLSQAEGDSLGYVQFFDYLNETMGIDIVYNDAEPGSALERSGVGLDVYGPNIAIGAPEARYVLGQETGAVVVLD